MKNMPKTVTNYLDDFLFLHYLHRVCEELLTGFLEICELTKFPVAIEKTVWPVEIIEFLGVLLNGCSLTIAVPEEKVNKALQQLRRVTQHKKVTIKALQQLAGTLNFINRGIVPGRTFTRRIYAKFAQKSVTSGGVQLKPHHHVRTDEELRNNCTVWETFLTSQTSVNRPFTDFHSNSFEAEQLGFFTDASKRHDFGFGCYFNGEWTFGH